MDLVAARGEPLVDRAEQVAEQAAGPVSRDHTEADLVGDQHDVVLAAVQRLDHLVGAGEDEGVDGLGVVLPGVVRVDDRGEPGAEAVDEQRVTGVLGRVYPGLTVDTTPTIGAEQATALAAEASGGTTDGTARLVVLPSGSGALAWEVGVVGATPEDMQAGRTIPLDEFKDRVRSKHGIRL